MELILVYYYFCSSSSAIVVLELFYEGNVVRTDYCRAPLKERCAPSGALKKGIW